MAALEGVEQCVTRSVSDLTGPPHEAAQCDAGPVTEVASAGLILYSRNEATRSSWLKDIKTTLFINVDQCMPRPSVPAHG
jgi:hypothetical protein